jgi:hypothetical protein
VTGRLSKTALFDPSRTSSLAGVRIRQRQFGMPALDCGERIEMSAQIVLLPVFVLVGLTFVLLLMAGKRQGADMGGETKTKGIALGLFELPFLFYILIALALPLRHADLVIVMLSWVFVVTCFARVGIFATSNDERQRSLAWLAGVLVLFAMWIYFALRILLLI